MKIIKNWIDDNKEFFFHLGYQEDTPSILSGSELPTIEPDEEYIICCDDDNLAYIMVLIDENEEEELIDYMNRAYGCTIFYYWNKDKWRLL